MNRAFQSTTPVPHPFNLLISTFLENRYRLPRLTKGVILKNNTPAVNEELLGVIQSLPLYRIFLDEFKNILGISNSFIEPDNIDSNKDIAVYCDIVHDATSTRIITLADFKYFLIQGGKLIPKKPYSDLEKTFFHKLESVITTKPTDVELRFWASSSWSDPNSTFLGTEFVNLFEEQDKQLMMTELNHIRPHWNDVHAQVITVWSTGESPNNKVNIRFDLVDGMEKDWYDLIVWILDNLFDFIQTELRKLDSKIYEGKVDLKKTNNFSNVLLYSLLKYSGADVLNNTENFIPRIKINTSEFIKELKNLLSKIQKQLHIDLKL